MAKLRIAHTSMHGARKHAWRTQAAWANFVEFGLLDADKKGGRFWGFGGCGLHWKRLTQLCVELSWVWQLDEWNNGLGLSASVLADGTARLQMCRKHTWPHLARISSTLKFSI